MRRFDANNAWRFLRDTSTDETRCSASVPHRSNRNFLETNLRRFGRTTEGERAGAVVLQRWSAVASTTAVPCVRLQQLGLVVTWYQQLE